MSDHSCDALLITPILPMETGLATYAMRILPHTREFVNWTVAYPDGGDPDSLPEGIRSLRIDQLEKTDDIPEIRIFQTGNSVHCFPVVQALYRYGGTTLFHEIVLHHMLRFCYLENNQLEEYRRELRFCYGPDAERVEKELSKKPPSEIEYDKLQMNYPLIGRALHASSAAVCLNSYATSRIENAFPRGRTLTIGHPLTPVDEDIEIHSKPFPVSVGMVGGYHPGRNLQKIVSAMELFRAEVPEAGLLLIGGGYPDDTPEWVVRTGRLPEREYQGWIRTLDYAIDMRYPTCGETSGSLLEAMRAGIPTIVSASDAFLNIPSDAVLRVSCDSMVQGLSRSLSYLHKRPDLRNSMSANAIAYSEDTGSVDRLKSDWKRIILMASESESADTSTVSNRYSLSAAWHDTPPGFIMDTSTEAVSWKYSGDVLIEGPLNSSEAEITICGTGSVNGRELPIETGVMSVKGKNLSFTGEGRVFCVLWK